MSIRIMNKLNEKFGEEKIKEFDVLALRDCPDGHTWIKVGDKLTKYVTMHKLIYDVDTLMN